GAGAAAAGAGAVAAGAAAGALGADVVAVLGGTICVVAPPATVSRPIRSSGGSSRNVYSRTNLPDDQFNSTSRSTNGSLIGCDEVIRTTAVPLARRSTAKRRLLSAGLYSRPAWRKASTGARRALREPASSRPSAVTSTSARKGCPSADWTVSLPSPAASADVGTPPASAAATASASRVGAPL